MLLSDPDSTVREKIIQPVAESLEDVKDFGSDNVLVVPAVLNEKVNSRL